ncbi:MAG: hypothetical protein P1V21_01325 [Rhizobiaceae bacterium]|nr:hypothetical protein [Rhizobiaceae bacterium]
MNWDWLTGFFRRKGSDDYSDPFFKWAVIVGAVTMIFVVCAGFNVINSDHPDIRARAFQPFFFAVFGAVTFLTIAWRGRISEKQTRLQLAQNESTQQQLQAAREQNIAEMYQKGAEMLSREEDVQVIAGIAFLETVAIDPNDFLAVRAMNILADYLQDNFSTSHSGKKPYEAVQALNAVNARYPNRFANRRLEFKTETKDEWLLVKGVAHVWYRGGTIVTIDLKNEIINRDPLNKGAESALSFNHLIFNSGRMCLPMAAHECSFVNIKFTNFMCEFIKNHQFENCDFSGCTVGNAQLFPDLRAQGCRYDPNNPPKTSGDFNWEKVLIPEAVVTYSQGRYSAIS